MSTSFHASLQHFGNTGSNSDTTDAFIMLGTTRFNMQQGHKIWFGNLDREVAKNIPHHHREAPLHYDHLELAAVNQIAKDAGRTTDVFNSLEVPVEDTGERFLTDCLDQELTRQSELPVDALSPRCPCPKCGGNPTEISGATVIRQLVSVPMAASVEPLPEPQSTPSNTVTHFVPVPEVALLPPIQPQLQPTAAEMHLPFFYPPWLSQSQFTPSIVH